MVITDMIGIVIVSICIAAIGVVVVFRVNKSPYSFPYFIQEFNISGVEDPCIDDMIDNMLIRYGVGEIIQHNKHIGNWEKETWERAGKSLFKQRRRRQYLEAVDDDHAFVFYFVVPQIVIRGTEHYKENVRVATYSYSALYLVNRYARLKDTEFRCTLNELAARKAAE